MSSVNWFCRFTPWTSIGVMWCSVVPWRVSTSARNSTMTSMTTRAPSAPCWTTWESWELWKTSNFQAAPWLQLRFDISRHGHHGRHGRHGRHAWLSGLWARCESPGFQGVDANSTAVSERLYQNGSPCWTNQILIAEIAGLPNVHL